MPKGILFLPAYYEAIKNLEDNDRLKLYDAIIRYGIFGEEPELTSTQKAIFAVIKSDFDNQKLLCSFCGKPITEKISDYSRENYGGKVLCMECQKKHKRNSLGILHSEFEKPNTPKSRWGPSEYHYDNE